METKPKKTIAPRVDMPCQPADVRAHNFDEVATGYTKEMAMQEASRCLRCDHFGYGIFRGGRDIKW